jgi:hypothetical protein
MNNKHKRMTEAEYQQLKGLLGYGISINQLTKMTGRSWNTITLVRDTDDLNAYYEKSREVAYRKPKAVETPEPTAPTATTEDNVERITQNLEKIADILSSLLTRVYELEQKTEKRGMFR